MQLSAVKYSVIYCHASNKFYHICQPPTNLASSPYS